MSTAVPEPLQLAATLSLLASAGYQCTVGKVRAHNFGNNYLIGMSQSTISKIIAHVLNKIETKLCTHHIKFSEERWSTCKQWFFQKYKIQGVVGCVDGTHFGLQKPSTNEHMFFNRKSFHSLNSMIICYHEYRILAVDSRYGGAAHDSFVWRHSSERQFLENKFDPTNNENFWLLGKWIHMYYLFLVLSTFTFYLRYPSYTNLGKVWFRFG
ncbi:putative nuclease HARBI1 [Episyrphus balteatus]|uniref:putative nuclease HARBI1 n=1 Tax=Episyrphus balteatus TaxID=286459 RepID=UPI002485ECB0|nr:putative nuclease HARBI1 [Episyrphus balteatus]